MYMAIFIRNWKQRALKDILRNIRNYSIFTHTKHVMSLKKKRTVYSYMHGSHTPFKKKDRRRNLEIDYISMMYNKCHLCPINSRGTCK